MNGIGRVSGMPADQEETSLLMLEYPNGRVAECVHGPAETFRVGTEFDLFGRRWRVYRIVAANRRHPEPRWQCMAIGLASSN